MYPRITVEDKFTSSTGSLRNSEFPTIHHREKHPLPQQINLPSPKHSLPRNSPTVNKHDICDSGKPIGDHLRPLEDKLRLLPASSSQSVSRVQILFRCQLPGSMIIAIFKGVQIPRHSQGPPQQLPRQAPLIYDSIWAICCRLITSTKFISAHLSIDGNYLSFDIVSNYIDIRHIDFHRLFHLVTIPERYEIFY